MSENNTAASGLTLKNTNKWNTRQLVTMALLCAIGVLLSGLGFAWLPLHLVEPLLQQKRLHRIQLKESSARKFFTHLVIPNPERLGPSATLLLECLRASHKLQSPVGDKPIGLTLPEVEPSHGPHTP